MMKVKSVKCGRFYGLDNQPGQLGKGNFNSVFFSNLYMRDTENLRYNYYVAVTRQSNTEIFFIKLRILI